MADGATGTATTPPSPVPGPLPALNLAAFIAVAQHEVQKVTEYLSRPELHRQDVAAPAPTMPLLGTLRMKVPVQIWQAPAPAPGKENAPPSDPEQLLVPGLIWPPGSQQAYTITVRTVGGSSETAGGFIGYLELEFNPCPK